MSCGSLTPEGEPVAAASAGEGTIEREPLQRLIAGFADLHAAYLEEDAGLQPRLVRDGQSPKAMMIGCSDAVVDPAQLTRGEPGGLYVLRNVAAMVPPYESAHFHGAKAAIEYGVKGLEVEHLIVIGHAHCGGLGALASRGEGGHDDFEHLWEWVMLAEPARQAVESALAKASPEIKRRAVEQAAVVVSLRNLLSYPWIRERAKARRLALHGWYFDLERGALQVFERRQGRFVSADEQAWPPCPHGDACPPGCTCERFVNLGRLLRPPARSRARRSSVA